jgi:lysophospholipase L1-like esterase
LALLAAATLAALAAAELAVRLLDPFGVSYYADNVRYFTDPGAIEFAAGAQHPTGRLFENRPDVDVEMRTFRFTTDARGLRTGPTARPADDAAGTTLLFLGDSVTLGWGVDDEDTWVRTLEREGRDAAGEPLRCLNAGHLQFNTVQEADWLRAHGASLAPDVVVVTFLVNDLDDQWAQYQGIIAELERLQADAPTAGQRLAATLRGWFRGFAAVAHYFDQRAAEGDAPPVTDARDAPHYAAGWARCAAALEALHAECAALGARLVVQDHTTPTIPDLAPWCAAKDVPLVPFTFTADEHARGIRNSRADAHANALGNRLLADKALAGLRAAGVLAAETPR